MSEAYNKIKKMKRYVRTKDDKLYEVQSASNGQKYLVRTGELIPMWNNKKWNTKAFKIIKESDNIEDLFDEITVKYYSKVRERYEYLHLENNEELKNYSWSLYEDDEYYVYGSIYTDKGIIYVAEMKKTQEGVFELL